MPPKSLRIFESLSWKELPARLTLSILVVILVISRFGFEGRIWVLIAPILGHCLLVFVVFTSNCLLILELSLLTCAVRDLCRAQR